jgi:hypothetical protein
MNLKLNDMACGFLQKHRQWIGPAPISIQARQVKRRGNFIFSFSFALQF